MDGHDIATIAALVEDRTGVIIPRYRWTLMGAELDRLGGQEAVCGLLAGSEAVWAELLTALAIPETYLFRHGGHFELLAETAVRLAGCGRPCRVLCAGCSTGEEAWSAAAVLASVERPLGSRHRVVGWELCRARVERARDGRFGSWAARHGLHGYDRHFVVTEGGLEVGPALRELVEFRQANLVEQGLPAADPFDVVLFRNVALYWGQETVDRFCVRLKDLVAEGGLVCVGPTDPISLPRDEWEHLVENRIRYFRRRLAASSQNRSAHTCAAFPGSPRSSAVVSRQGPKPSPRSCGHLKAERSTSKRTSPPGKLPLAAVDSVSGSAAEARLEAVRAYADGGRYLEALDLLDSGIADGTPEGSLWRGILLLSLGREEEAVRYFRQCVFLRPEEAEYRRWLAVAYQTAGRAAEAEREFRNAEQLERA